MSITTQVSKAAFKSVKDTSHLQEARVLEAIRACGRDGATCDEVERILDGRHQTISARVHDLMVKGNIFPLSTFEGTPVKRKTRAGRKAIVWVAG